ncbi:tripartite tricarboxylate transporter TctB family protein [Salinarimonas soli]|uniref:Tripartite tricarboxylate transporter TctB family protein n=1 Tax=Salinarimonas soli TaxID=1638099 RepID=A0A5B2VEL9_9HYPH|nr:tripartite tricarboxylate transporter TctB family protein [Salinarimonas soli]KAA2237551.1 tripartite tricarboxylate transporter TctB family protein [Salinarimonas soli]
MSGSMQPRAAGVSRRAVEVVTASAFAAIGIVGLWDSSRIGAGWGTDGPQSGYFPFWIALIMTGASLFTLVSAWRDAGPDETFLTRPQLGLVLSILAPATAFVLAIAWAGLYVPAALLIAWFMARLGGYSWRAGLLTGASIAVLSFVTFEIWFLVPLPKGPLETWLGY